MVLFSFATPFGICLGLLLENSSEIVEIIFTSLAGGTFIYVSCSELIVEEFALPGNRWWKFLAFIIGAIIITLLWFFDS
jgi:zinc transporter ZupT